MLEKAIIQNQFTFQQNRKLKAEKMQSKIIISLTSIESRWTRKKSKTFNALLKTIFLEFDQKESCVALLMWKNVLLLKGNVQQRKKRMKKAVEIEKKKTVHQFNTIQSEKLNKRKDSARQIA